jgi:hypothetical protein
MTNNLAWSYNPSVAVSSSVVHVVWVDKRDGQEHIYYKRSTDAGISWGTDTRLTNNTASSFNPSVALSGSTVHVVWFDNRDYNYELYYKRSIDGGANWEADTRLTYDTAYSSSPSVAVSGSVVHVVWLEIREGNLDIYYKRSTDVGLSWGADTRLMNNTTESSHASVAVSGSVVNVVWEDNRDGNYEIYYKRNPTGNPIGIQNINTETPSKYSLSQNYPNPFNSTSNLKFEILYFGHVKLIVCDVMGREVQTLVNEKLQPGMYETTFDGSMLNSGVYFYKITAENFTETKKMLLIK